MKKAKTIFIIIYILTIISCITFFVIRYYEYRETVKLSEINEKRLFEIIRASANIQGIKDVSSVIEKKQEEFENGYYKSEKNIKLPVLIYHCIDDTIPKNDYWNLYVTTERFEENIKTLLEEGYTFITFDDLYEYNKGIKKLPEKNILMTIDDGYENNYTKAYPILKKYNIKANIFLIVNYRGDSYMTWDQIREMHSSGLVKFYTHGNDHIDYTTVSISKLKEDVLSSHEDIERELGVKILKVFAYPSGAYNRQTINALKSIGFETQVLTKYGTVNKSNKLDLTDIGRIRVENKTTGKQIINIIK